MNSCYLADNAMAPSTSVDTAYLSSKTLLHSFSIKRVVLPKADNFKHIDNVRPTLVFAVVLC